MVKITILILFSEFVHGLSQFSVNTGADKESKLKCEYFLLLNVIIHHHHHHNKYYKYFSLINKILF